MHDGGADHVKLFEEVENNIKRSSNPKEIKPKLKMFLPPLGFLRS